MGDPQPCGVAFPARLNFIGTSMNQNSIPHLRQRVRPSRTAGPMNPPNQPTDNAVPENFPCPNCDQAFKTSKGLGVHRRIRHHDATNEEVVVERVKKRWSPEELRLLAQLEAEAVVSGGVRFINEHLLRHGSGERTLEAIKGARKAPAYKQLVARAIEELNTRSGPAQAAPTPSSQTPTILSPQPSTSRVSNAGPANGDDWNTSIQDLSVVACTHDSHQAIRLAKIATALLKGEQINDSCENWLSDVFPVSVARAQRHQRAPPAQLVPRWRLRRREYARTQELFRTRPDRVASEVLDGRVESEIPEMPDMFGFWEPIMTRPSTTYPRATNYPRRPDLAALWRPISVDDISTIEIPATSSAGLDGISSALWRAVPPPLRALFYNALIMEGGFSVERLRSRTVFIPKKKVSKTPGDFRPISISSVVVRQLHKIFAARLHEANLIDLRQRCLDDGCAENVAILASLLKDAKFRLRELHAISLDCAKAYDSVSHHAIETVMYETGLPAELVRYVTSVYARSSTVLEVQGERSQPISVSSGVRQGDPLSTFIFCLVMDRVVKKMPSVVGYELGDTRINALMYADDVILVTSTRSGMQTSLGLVETTANTVGLTLNTDKCLALSLVPSGKQKKLKVITTPLYKLNNGAFLKQLTTVDEWRYLGVNFKFCGPKRAGGSLIQELSNITKAPLRPQQRLFILRCFLMPRLYYNLVLAGATLGKMRALDMQVRSAVRKWLNLPHDIPKGYFHAACRDGGLGLPSVETSIPILMQNRLNSLANSTSPGARAAFNTLWVQERLRWAERASLKSNGVSLQNGNDSKKWWADSLHHSVDGHELRESAQCSASSSWVDHGNYLSGRDYISYQHVRINCIPSRIRTSRGVRRQDMEVMCRAGCQCTETAAHVIQSCHRTHGGRILRHDAICKVVSSGLRDKGYAVELEPHFQTIAGMRKPDIVAVRDGVVNIIDAQVVSGSTSLDDSHVRKTRYYGNNQDLCRVIADKYKVLPSRVNFTSCTLSWRGIWSSKSANSLLALGLSKKLLGFVTLRAIRGSHMNWQRWNRMTTTWLGNQPRQGIG